MNLRRIDRIEGNWIAAGTAAAKELIFLSADDLDRLFGRRRRVGRPLQARSQQAEQADLAHAPLVRLS